MIYLVLPCGSNFGWGICGKYLVKELSDLAETALITEDFSAGDIGDELEYHFLKSRLASRYSKGRINVSSRHVAHPVLQAITDQTLRPWLADIKGAFKAGYTFFEMNVLPPQSIKNGLDNFDVIVTGSKWCEDVLRTYGLNRVATIIQGVDPQLFNPSHNEKQMLKDRFVVFSGGKFEFRKGQDIVIRAYKVLQDRHPDVMLVNAWHNPWPFSMKTMETSPYIHCRISDSDYLKIINGVLQSNGIDSQRVISVLPRAMLKWQGFTKIPTSACFPTAAKVGRIWYSWNTWPAASR